MLALHKIFVDAVAAGQTELVEALFQGGLDVTDGYALDIAVMNRDIPMMSLLYKHGVTDEFTCDGHLDNAVYHNDREDVVDWLLAHFPSCANSLLDDGLSMAKPRYVWKALHAGADAANVAVSNCSLAKYDTFDAIVGLALDLGADVSSLYYDALHTNNVRMIEYLKAHGVTPHEHTLVAIERATEAGYHEAVKATPIWFQRPR